MSQEKRFLQRLAGGWIYIVWIYLSVAWRFCGWRLSLWFHRTPESNHTGMKQTLLFIRHGQTTWNVEHRLPGQLPGIDLNDTGRQQAARLSDALMVLPISAIISSPLERARETAEIIAQPRNLPVQIEPRLMDIDVGHWTGQDHDKINKEDPAWKAFVKDPTVAPPDVETFPQVQQRALEAVEYWRAEGNIARIPPSSPMPMSSSCSSRIILALRLAKPEDYPLTMPRSAWLNWNLRAALASLRLAGIRNPAGSNRQLLRLNSQRERRR